MASRTPTLPKPLSGRVRPAGSHMEAFLTQTFERITSAIRHATESSLCIVATESGRWLIVRGYPEERKRALSEPGMMYATPLVDNVEVIGESSEAEFHWHCAN